MRSTNRVTLFCVLVWLVCLAGAWFLHDDTDIQYRLIDGEAIERWPLVLQAGDVLSVRIDSPASTRLIALDIQGVESDDFLIRIGVNGAWPVCSANPRTCRLMVTATGSTSVYLNARNQVTIDAVRTTVVKHQWNSAAASGLPLLLVGVLLMLPLSWLTAGTPLLQRRLLLVSTLSMMTWLQPVFTMTVIIVLAILHRLGIRTAAGNRLALTIALGGAALILVAAKYAISGIGQIFADPGSFDLALPLGISYVVIRVVDTQIRWFRNQLRDVPLDEFMFFVLFPATLAAGPVDTLDRFRSGRSHGFSAEMCASGLVRIGWGAFKKLVIADALLLPMLWSADGFGVPMLSPVDDDPSVVVIFLFVAFAYVYVDFSAYSDIAIGLSRMLGWSAPENFNFPFLARSIMDYWRRWHMSVSGWCMRNIYMPLLLSTRRPAVASFMVMLAVGMWHSIGLSWLMWAVHHGVLVALEATFDRRRRRVPAASRMRSRAAEGNWLHVLRTIPGRAGTLVWVAAGHAFAQIEDPMLALDVYFRFWRGIVSIPARLIQ